MRVRAHQAAGQPHRGREHLGRVLDVGEQVVEVLAVLLEDLQDGGLEQLGLAREVVVERPEPDVGGLGELLNAEVGTPPAGQHVAGGRDQRLARPGLSAGDAVGSLPCVGLSGHPPTVEEALDRGFHQS
ncbi:hypothetical protein GCM10020369_39630 [Cryptosporangium minutisporangium]|uniref:Uncharacterized protein n=1 Tax=Cryptosporangium minutisporangium TaxID=113569 RepID=A0ABP6T130_9ACTN